MVSKLHEVAKAYCSMFCYQFGGPLGKTASRSEEHHGWRSRKNVNTIDQQCGRQIADAFIIDTMYTLFEDPAKEDETPARAQSVATEEMDSEVQTREEGSGTRYNIRRFATPTTTKRTTYVNR